MLHKRVKQIPGTDEFGIGADYMNSKFNAIGTRGPDVCPTCSYDCNNK